LKKKVDPEREGAHRGIGFKFEFLKRLLGINHGVGRLILMKKIREKVSHDTVSLSPSLNFLDLLTLNLERP
jgi:hypothetical protein